MLRPGFFWYDVSFGEAFFSHLQSVHSCDGMVSSRAIHVGERNGRFRTVREGVKRSGSFQPPGPGPPYGSL